MSGALPFTTTRLDALGRLRGSRRRRRVDCSRVETLNVVADSSVHSPGFSAKRDDSDGWRRLRRSGRRSQKCDGSQSYAHPRTTSKALVICDEADDRTTIEAFDRGSTVFWGILVFAPPLAGVIGCLVQRGTAPQWEHP